MKRNHPHTARGRKCALETLESRLVMAGLVHAWVDVHSVLHITDDSADNHISIVQKDGQYKVMSNDGTIVLDKTTHPAPALLPAFTSIDAKMGGGNDGIEIVGSGNPATVNMYASITIDIGSGVGNYVDVGSGVIVTGDLMVRGTGGASVHIDGAIDGKAKTVGGTTKIDVGAGPNKIGLTGEFNSVIVSTGGGGYDVGLGGFAKPAPREHSKFKATTVHVTTGGGNDTLRLYKGRVADSIFADLGSGNDGVELYYWTFPKNRNDTTIQGNSGNNSLTKRVGDHIHNYPGNDRFPGFH